MKKSSIRIISLAIVMIMALGLAAACGPTAGGGDAPPPAPPSPGPAAGSPTPAPVQSSPEPPPAEARFADHLDIIVDNAQITVLNPFSPASGSGSTNWCFFMMYDRMLTNLGEGEYGPNLATSFDTDDYQTYVFTLRQDVWFHNGDKFTAQDVIDTIMASRDGLGSNAFDFWRPVETVTALDEYTVEMVLSDVNVDFLYGLTLPATGIINKRAMDQDSENGTWIGTGAYRVVEFVSNDYVVFERNDDYWGDAPFTRMMTLRFVPEMSTRTIMMQNGESQLCLGGNSAEDIHLFQNDPDSFEVIPVVFTNANTISFNLEDPIAGDLNFRMAVASAINREEIAIVAAGEWAWPVEDGTMWGFNTEFKNYDIPQIPHDLDAARAYLEASTYNGEEIEIVAAITTNVRAAQAVQQQLSAIGVNITINQMDPPSLFSYAAYGNNQSQLNMMVTALTPNVASLRSVFYPGAAYNRASFNNPRVTEILDLGPTIGNIDERRALYYEMQEIVHAEQPVINLFWRVVAVVAARGVGGMVLTSDTYYDLRYTYMVLD